MVLQSSDSNQDQNGLGSLLETDGNMLTRFAVLERGMVYDGYEVEDVRQRIAWMIQVPVSMVPSFDQDYGSLRVAVDDTIRRKILSLDEDQLRIGTAIQSVPLSMTKGTMIKKTIEGKLVTQDGLQLECHSDYVTARSSISVSGSGRWMFEVILDCTVASIKVGWASSHCRMSDADGVGDTPNSYGFDGRARWNDRFAAAYGSGWAAGDVIGVCLDLDASEISFWRNGCALGVAFTGARDAVHTNSPLKH